MTGVFSMKPNTRNVRDLDFEIKVGLKKNSLFVLKNRAFEHFLKLFKIHLRLTSMASWGQ